MKVKMLSVTLFLSIFGASIMPAQAADPCEVVLCLYGKAVGQGGGSSCSGPEKAFFSINAFKKKGRFDPTKTLNMRKSFLGGCSTADPAAVSKILSKFGKLRG